MAKKQIADDRILSDLEEASAIIYLVAFSTSSQIDPDLRPVAETTSRAAMAAWTKLEEVMSDIRRGLDLTGKAA